jgi:hypothetical protein
MVFSTTERGNRMSDTPTPLKAEGLIVLAQSGKGMIVEMRLPLLAEGHEPDLHNRVHHMIAFLAQNWEMFDKLAKVDYTKFVEAEAAKDADGVEDAKIVTPSGLKLVASDGQSLLQH